MPQCLIDRPAGVERAPHEDMLPHAPFFDSPSQGETLREQRGDSYLTLDSFDGFPAEREELASFFTRKGQGNTLVWTGDVHNCYAGHWLEGETRRAAFEMTTGSVTTFGVGDVLRWGSARLVEGHIRRSNRHYEFVDLRHHMYVRVTLTSESALHETICVDTVLRNNFRTFTGQSLNVAKGTLEIFRV